MARLSVAPRAKDDGRIAATLDRYVRRVTATPPGTCPVVVKRSLLQAAAAQTCGKCVPCRDGLSRLAALVGRVADCEADAGTLAEVRALAEMVRGTSDCAIGFEAANALLEGLDDFADEFARHVGARSCAAGVGQTVPCETLCPAHVDVPGYIGLVAAGDYAGAVNLVRKDNPFPTACAFVCEHPCEARCRRTLIDAPVNIRGIKRFAADQAPADRVAPPPHSVDTARNIAVVGGGPSGLTCAYFLALMGHRVTVFEARSQLGGMLRYGIPAYRLPRERLDEDLRGILSAGSITALCDTRVGAREMAEIAENYYAVYVAWARRRARRSRCRMRTLRASCRPWSCWGPSATATTPTSRAKKVAVVGGGNVAMDCARTAVRRRRRGVRGVPPPQGGHDGASGRGGAPWPRRGTGGAAGARGHRSGRKGRCAALVTQPQMIGAVRAGRPAPVTADRPQERIAADVVLIAVGQGVETEPFEEFGMATVRGCFDADEGLAAAGHDNVFVGGDCQTGPATVIRAIAAGKVAARNIDAYLGCSHKLACGVSARRPRPTTARPRAAWSWWNGRRASAMESAISRTSSAA